MNIRQIGNGTMQLQVWRAFYAASYIQFNFNSMIHHTIRQRCMHFPYFIWFWCLVLLIAKLHTADHIHDNRMVALQTSPIFTITQFARKWVKHKLHFKWTSWVHLKFYVLCFMASLHQYIITNYNKNNHENPLTECDCCRS